MFLPRGDDAGLNIFKAAEQLKDTTFGCGFQPLRHCTMAADGYIPREPFGETRS
jgi:hypothetical protein